MRQETKRATPDETADASALARIVHHLEPSPAGFAEVMTASKWWWAFMMDMHFVGLVLLMGTIGLLDLRLLGFAKQIPIGSLHRLLPWAMVGFGRSRKVSKQIKGVQALKA